MNDGYIAILDSGVGGLSVLFEMIKLMPNEKYIYFGDNKNAPYGNRTKTDLVILTLKNIDIIMRYKIKALVIGCNTISTTILEHVSSYSGVPTFGVFPPVETVLTKTNNALLLATLRTAKEYKNQNNITVLGLSNLASDIENNLADLSRVNLIDNINNPNNVFYGNKNLKSNRFDTVILGCTHYFFIKNKIHDHFRPQNLIDGSTFTAKAVFEYFKNAKSLGNNKHFAVNFIGKNAFLNERFFKQCGQFIKKN